MAKRLLVLHGPNMNLLGEGSLAPLGTLASLNDRVRKRARELGAEVKFAQGNDEGALVEALHAARTWTDGVILNLASLPAAAALRGALAILGLRCVEVRLDDFPGRSADGVEAIHGKGIAPYLDAVDKLCPPSAAMAKVAQAPAAKTIGRRKAAGTPPRPVAKADKTLGPAPKEPSGEPPGVSRAQVREMIGQRLKGDISAGMLASWAREKWLAVDRGGPTESGQRELLEEVLQTLAVSAAGPLRVSDDDLIVMMSRLG